MDCAEKSAVWGIPFGHVERRFDPDNIEPLDTTFVKLAARPLGDFPAHHWAWRSARQGGVALLTRGLPSVRWTPGCFELSLLRSPQMTGDTVVPSLHEFWDVDGTRDTGRHRLEFSVWPSRDSLSPGALARQGYAYNRASPPLPFELEGDVVVTAWKPAAHGEGCILRLYEAGGVEGQVRLTFDRARRVRPVDLMERPIDGSEQPAALVHCFPLHRHQIWSLQID